MEKTENVKLDRATHGIGLNYEGEDGVLREFHLVLQDQRYHIRFITWWDGKDKEPSDLRFFLSKEAYDKFANMVVEFELNRDRHAIQYGERE